MAEYIRQDHHLPHGSLEPHITNADCIRAMSDEELAEHILVIKATKDYCNGDCNCLIQKDKTCYKCRLEWLRKEADE